MLKKIISTKTTNRSKNFIIWKLKKKWRFWRVFRFYFLRRNKKFFFPKIKWLFNQRRVIWHQLSIMYGKKIKNYAFANHRSKKIFNSKFGSILCKLELRLNVLLVRIGFVDKLLKASSLILTGKIKINNIRKNKRYVISSNDLISSSPAYLKINNVKRFKKLRWRRLKWKKWQRQSNKKKFRQIYFLLKRNFIFNFMEINYYYHFGILLRRPLIGEIVYRNKKRLLTAQLLQKVYFLY